MKRKLSTIVSVDVAGYSRLMGRDEEGTHARLSALFRELLEPAAREHAGVVIKKTGDGLLADFASVVEAVRYAIQVQKGAAERNAHLPTERHIIFRIGVNLGDVIVDAGEIFGDGVNIAVRLESIAEPGTIVVSRAVRNHVRDKLNVAFEDMGAQRLKNIARPLRAYRIRPEGSPNQNRGGAARGRLHRGAPLGLGAAGAAMVVASLLWWPKLLDLQPVTAALFSDSSALQTNRGEPEQRFSIVVLPFANLSADPQQDYFVDGITESLTTDLSRVLPGSFVVARRTALIYKNKPIDPGEIVRDLKAHYYLEGSVVIDGDQVRVNARLMDAETNTELWAERFDTERTDVLEIQDRIVGRLSRSVGLKLVDIQARRSERDHPHNASAVDLVMRGQATVNRPASRESMLAARGLFQQALQYEPDDVDALAGVATTYLFEVLNSYYETGREERLRKASVLVDRALAIEPRHIVALRIHAGLLRAEGNFDAAISASKAVIEQNPGEPWAYKEVGLSELYLGRFQDALDWFEKADQIGPRDPGRWIWLGAMGRVQFFLGNNDQAIRLLKLSAEANPKDVRAYALLAAVFALSDRSEDASQALASCLRLRPETTISELFDDWSVPLDATSPIYRRQHERFREGLRLAGMSEGTSRRAPSQ
ncbi:MAG TPA: tetratricopeptide repeat protein [Stellaceae bacterium]|nr:tetratricopeptide repeat protein [Stellaceae bacterium]